MVSSQFRSIMVAACTVSIWVSFWSRLGLVWVSPRSRLGHALVSSWSRFSLVSLDMIFLGSVLFAGSRSRSRNSLCFVSKVLSRSRHWCSIYFGTGLVSGSSLSLHGLVSVTSIPRTVAVGCRSLDSMRAATSCKLVLLGERFRYQPSLSL